MHSAGQCSTSQSIRHRLCVRTRKVALEFTAFTGKRVVKNARQTLQFYSGVCDVYIYRITFFTPWIMFFIPGGALQYLTKWKPTWIYSASYFANVKCAQGFIVGLIFVFSRANGKLQRPIRVKKEICCLDTAEFIDRVFSLRGMNKKESKVKVGINYGKSFLKVSPKTMVDYYNYFKLYQSSPSGSAFKFSGAKRMLLQVPETHFNRQEIVYLAKITRFRTTYSPAV